VGKLIQITKTVVERPIALFFISWALCWVELADAVGAEMQLGVPVVFGSETTLRKFSQTTDKF